MQVRGVMKFLLRAQGEGRYSTPTELSTFGQSSVRWLVLFPCLAQRKIKINYLFPLARMVVRFGPVWNYVGTCNFAVILQWFLHGGRSRPWPFCLVVDLWVSWESCGPQAPKLRAARSTR